MAQNLIAEHYGRYFYTIFHFKTAQNLIAEHYERYFYMIFLFNAGRHRCPLSPKFQFYFKKGSSKKISYERRAYESVDEKSLS